MPFTTSVVIWSSVQRDRLGHRNSRHPIGNVVGGMILQNRCLPVRVSPVRLARIQGYRSRPLTLMRCHRG